MHFNLNTKIEENVTYLIKPELYRSNVSCSIQRQLKYDFFCIESDFLSKWQLTNSQYNCNIYII